MKNSKGNFATFKSHHLFVANPGFTWNCSLSTHIIIKFRKKIQWEERKRWKRWQTFIMCSHQVSQLILCSRTSTESGLMPSVLHRTVTVKLRVKGTRKGQAVLLEKNRRSTLEDKIGLHFSLCQVLLTNNSNSFSPKQVFGSMRPFCWTQRLHTFQCPMICHSAHNLYDVSRWREDYKNIICI